jgi:hypothetical protein
MYRRKANEFAEMSGVTQPPTSVTLPHDAISTPRDPGLTNGSGFGTANPIDETTVFTDPTYRSFAGRALVVLRPTGIGAVRVMITARDLSTHVDLSVDEAPTPRAIIRSQHMSTAGCLMGAVAPEAVNEGGQTPPRLRVAAVPVDLRATSGTTDWAKA